MKKLILFILISVFISSISYAELVCLRVKQTKKGNIKTIVKTVDEDTCPRKFKEIVNTDLLVGPTGPQGPAGNDGAQGPQGDQGLQGPAGSDGSDGSDGAPGTPGADGSDGAPGTPGLDGDDGNDGADGMDAAWGDGSAGNVTISSTQHFYTTETNPQFGDFTINSSVTLIVSSGTIIRCKGDFVNNGSIVVSNAATSGYSITGLGVAPTDMIDMPMTVPHPGISNSIATRGQVVSNDNQAAGGFGGQGHSFDTVTFASPYSLYNLTKPPLYGGGAGAGIYFSATYVPEPNGGGSFAVYCEGSITNNGDIDADGGDALSSGDGGGGGGVLIFASKGTFLNAGTGTISANGGDGGAWSTTEGPGGGGGGGLVHILAPVITDSGAINVNGGTGGTAASIGDISASVRAGGSGGGGSVGLGGFGGTVLTDDSSLVPVPGGQNGTSGAVIQRTITNPAGLLN